MYSIEDNGGGTRRPGLARNGVGAVLKTATSPVTCWYCLTMPVMVGFRWGARIVVPEGHTAPEGGNSENKEVLRLHRRNVESIEP